MASDGEVKNFLKDGKNGTSLLCQRCSSIILRPNLAVFTEKEVNVANVTAVFKNSVPSYGTAKTVPQDCGYGIVQFLQILAI